MSEWKEFILGGNHIDLISGFAFKSKNFLEYKEEGSLPVIKIKNVANGDVNLEKVVYHKYDESLEKYMLSYGDVLIAMTGNHPQAITQVVGDVSKYKLRTEALLNQRVGKIIAKGENDLNFFYYFFKNEETHRYLANNSSGSANQANISKNDILGLISEIPEPIEQRAIAEVLSSLDDKIDLLHRQNKTLEQMAETLFRQWFVPARAGEPHAGGEEAKEDWEKRPLKSFCKVITKGTTPTSLKRKFVDEGINFIKVNCIDDNGTFIYDKFNFIDEETHNIALKRSILQEGDLLYSIAGTIGRISEVTAEVLPANVNQALAIIRVNKEVINPYYVKYSLKDPNVTFDIHSKIVHAVQPNLSLGEIGSTLIPLPDKKIRRKFNEIINPLEEKIKSNQTQIRTLEKMRDTLLPKLMSGEVRVKF